MAESPIIITGMHRSGTTLLTKLLERCGVFLGNKKFMNEEAVFFQDINRWLLYQSNTTWDNPGAFNYTHQAFEQKALNAILWRMTSYHIKDYLGIMKSLKYRSLLNLDFQWGWKDPVNSITLKLWMKAFPDAKIVSIIRNPVDVALSLKSREEKRLTRYAQQEALTSREKKLIKKPAYSQSYKVMHLRNGIELALDYMYLNEGHLNKYADQSICLRYEKLLQHPENELSKLITFLNVDVDKQDIGRAAGIVNQDNGYKFTQAPALKHLFQEMAMQETFDHFGFQQPDFLS